MNMFARFDEIPAMTFQDIKKKNVTDGRTHGRTDGQTDGQRENSIPTTNKVCGGIITQKAESNCAEVVNFVFSGLAFNPFTQHAKSLLKKSI